MINHATGYCSFPLCDRIEDKNGFCLHHKIYSTVDVKKEAPKAIPKQSEKRKKEKRVLSVLKAIKMVELDGLCQLKGANCQYYALDYEHIQKSSPANYIDPNNGTIACRNCNRDKELYPKLFQEHSISKFKK